ncbi:MAG: hypothetical protein ACOYIK_07590, partial [Coriobacteriales bacterium]
HNCGMAAHYMEILHTEAHVNGWDPAQTMNDLDAFREKWGNEILLAGCWDAKGQILEPGCPEEVIVEDIKATFDRFAPIGGYAFSGGMVGPLDDEEVKRKNDIIMKTALEYGGSFYD